MAVSLCLGTGTGTAAHGIVEPCPRVRTRGIQELECNDVKRIGGLFLSGRSGGLTQSRVARVCNGGENQQVQQDLDRQWAWDNSRMRENRPQYRAGVVYQNWIVDIVSRVEREFLCLLIRKQK